ncbi:hypothetical protein KDL29_02870 [bacterium]|nr:hypothetical protein [bacterium]
MYFFDQRGVGQITMRFPDEEILFEHAFELSIQSHDSIFVRISLFGDKVKAVHQKLHSMSMNSIESPVYVDLEGVLESGSQVRLKDGWLSSSPMEAAFNRKGRVHFKEITVYGQQSEKAISHYEYEVVNCTFDGRAGNSNAINFDDPLYNTIYIENNNYTIIISKMDTAIAELEKGENKTGVTARINVETNLDQASIDSIVESLCLLLQLCSYNSVRCVSCKAYANDRFAYLNIRPRGAYPFSRSHGIIPYNSEIATIKNFYFKSVANYFINVGLESLVNHKYRNHIEAVINLYIHGIRGEIDSVQFTLWFIAFERLQEAYKSDIPKVCHTPSGTFNKLNDLCLYFGVSGLKQEHIDLRNSLIHDGDIESISSLESHRMLKEFSHILIQCILKSLDYKGPYFHHGTDWKEKLVDPTFA